MITDQKTQNRLHADTGTELFSIRQRKEAVTRMLDILKETPEYLQVMNHIPAYAMDDDTSEWWNSEESENFMNSLLEVMESYTPDGYRFGPKSGTTDLYGYWESKTGRTTLFHLLFSLESGYDIYDCSIFKNLQSPIGSLRIQPFFNVLFTKVV